VISPIRQPVEYINSKMAFSIGLKQASLRSSISRSVKNLGILFPTFGSWSLEAGFFAIFPSSCAHLNNDFTNRIRWVRGKKMQISIEEYIQNMSEKAVKYKSFSFSENDINELEEILDYYSNDLKGNFFNRLIKKFNKTTPTDNQIYSMSIIWGSYLGGSLKEKY
jgi:hypothetical protein